MTIINKFGNRVNELIELADKTLLTQVPAPDRFYYTTVNSELFSEFRTSSLSFILNLYGGKHPFYNGFEQTVRTSRLSEVQRGRGILKAIKSEIDGGWFTTLKGLVSAEIFVDFLEMAEHLLKEGYKDPAAVVIGTVLEEHLRQLCGKNGITVENEKAGKNVAKKADLLNVELAGVGVYNKLDQKSVTAWLGLRNDAAHGKYDEYNKVQVELMLQAVTDFLSRNSL